MWKPCCLVRTVEEWRGGEKGGAWGMVGGVWNPTGVDLSEESKWAGSTEMGGEGVESQVKWWGQEKGSVKREN